MRIRCLASVIHAGHRTLEECAKSANGDSSCGETVSCMGAIRPTSSKFIEYTWTRVRQEKEYGREEAQPHLVTLFVAQHKRQSHTSILTHKSHLCKSQDQTKGHRAVHTTLKDLNRL